MITKTELIDLSKFAIEIYAPSETPGMVKRIGNVTYGELKRAVTQFIDQLPGNELHGEFSYEWVEVGNYGSEGIAIPDLWPIFVTSYTGTNEGYKVVIAGLDGEGKHATLLVIKTFSTRKQCFDLACELSKWLSL